MTRQRFRSRALTLAALTLSSFAMLAPALAASVDDAFIGSLAGGWAGRENTTPFGRMDFALVFEWQGDGSLLAFTPMNEGTFIELRFAKDASGAWLLHERAALEGMGEQRYTLHPVAAEGAMRRWDYLEKPGFLTVDVAATASALHMKVLLRGADHVIFDLARLDEATTARTAAALRQAATRTAREAPLAAAAHEDDVPASLRALRERVALAPNDADAHFALSRALLAALQSEPGGGPRYAGELLRTLQTTIALDPARVDAYRMLVGYYLNAPPIAGGSVAKAEELVRTLQSIDEAAAKEVGAMVDEARNAR